MRAWSLAWRGRRRQAGACSLSSRISQSRGTVSRPSHWRLTQLTDAQWARIARQHDREGASGRDGGARQQGRPPPFKPRTGQEIGRSRGGLTTKLHALVLEDRLPLILTLTPGTGAMRPGDAGCWSGSVPYLVSRR